MKIRVQELVPVPEVCPLRMGRSDGLAIPAAYCHECQFNKSKPNVIAFKVTSLNEVDGYNVLTEACVDCSKMDELMGKKVIP
jgi:hypothetical protein